MSTSTTSVSGSVSVVNANPSTATGATLLSETVGSDLTFSQIIIGIVIALILVTLWTRALENWLFVSLCIDKKSTFQTLVIAVAFTIIFFYFLSVVSSFTRGVILGTNGTSSGTTNTEQLFQSAPTVTVNTQPRCPNNSNNSNCNNGNCKKRSNIKYRTLNGSNTKYNTNTSSDTSISDVIGYVRL